MGFEQTLTTIICAITVVGVTLGMYVTSKIYSKDGYR